MKDGVGEGLTRADHYPLMSQLYAVYARTNQVRLMSRIVGEADLPEIDRKYLHFGRIFEKRFVAQRRDERRTIEETLDLGWRALACLPVDELTRLSKEEIEMHAGLLQQCLEIIE